MGHPAYELELRTGTGEAEQVARALNNTNAVYAINYVHSLETQEIDLINAVQSNPIVYVTDNDFIRLCC